MVVLVLYSVCEESGDHLSQSRTSLPPSSSYLSHATAPSLCTLEAAIRVPEGSEAAYKTFSFDDNDHPYAAAFREASLDRSIIHLSESNQQRVFPKSFKHILYKHAPSDPSPDVIILALPPITGVSHVASNIAEPAMKHTKACTDRLYLAWGPWLPDSRTQSSHPFLP